MPFARCAAVVGLLVLAPGAARAYEFEVDAQSIAQGYQIRWFRFNAPDELLNRRRFTQSLVLNIWDLLSPAPDYAAPEPPRHAPVDLYFTSWLRFDHDFGEYTQGDLVVPDSDERAGATSLVPELDESNLALDMLYAYVGGRNLFHRLDFELGRLLLVDTFDWVAMDGLHARLRTPWRFAVEAQGGLIVRDSSPFGDANYEPDGTSSADCHTIVAIPGSDAGSLVIDATPAECAQREQPMPSFGFAVETDGLGALSARVSYRRSFSPTADGYYIDARDAAPSWGVNEEKLAGSLRGNLLQGGIVPWAAARWNILVGVIDEAGAGVRLTWPSFAVTPEVSYSFPTFDGDSIWNVFSIEPYWDGRLTFDLWPGRGRLRAFARAFARRFSNSDTDNLLPGEHVPDSVLAGGGTLGAGWRWPTGSARLDVSYEDGYGGLRAGGDASGRWQIRPDIGVEGRLTVIRFDEDLLAGLHATTFGAQGGALFRLGRGIALHVLAEENTNRFFPSQFRLIGILDLAFQPEL